jgi:diguanylate cyclase (GGDEF)-like protein
VNAIPTLLVPGGLLALAFLASGAGGRLPEELVAFLRVYPWVVYGAGVLLGLRLRRGRVVLALAALALADRALAHFGVAAVGGQTARYVLNATAFLLPLDLAWLAVTRERGTFTSPGLTRLALIAAQPAIAAFVWLSYQPSLVALLESRFLPGRASPETDLAHPAVVAYAAAVLVSALVWALRQTVIEAGFCWALAASFVALVSPRSATLFLATGGLILTVALVESAFAMAFRDGLTSLPSRRAFDEAVEKLSGRFAVAIVDVDHFKAINDRYGHDIGDQVLRMIAARLGAAGGGARVYRIGGEEFALVFPGKSAAEASAEAESVRAGVAGAPFALRSPTRPARKPKRPPERREAATALPVTVSIGVAGRAGRVVAPEDVVKAADAALYRAKRAGRNRVSG